MTTPLDLATARQYAAQVVEAQGRDFVYNPNGAMKCLYVPAQDADDSDPRGKTGCLVGRILDLHGLTAHHGAEAPIRELVYDGTHGGPLASAMDDDTVEYLQVLQTSQDCGRSWGDAFNLAEGAAVTVLADRKRKKEGA